MRRILDVSIVRSLRSIATPATASISFGGKSSHPSILSCHHEALSLPFRGRSFSKLLAVSFAPRPPAPPPNREFCPIRATSGPDRSRFGGTWSGSIGSSHRSRDRFAPSTVRSDQLKPRADRKAMMRERFACSSQAAQPIRNVNVSSGDNRFFIWVHRNRIASKFKFQP